MNRRAVLTAAGSAVTVALAGCASEGASEDDGENSADDGGSDSDEGTDEPESDVRVDETVYGGDPSYNLDVEEGDTISVDVDVHEGDLTIVRVVEHDDFEALHREDVYTDASFEVEATDAELHSVRVVPQGQTDIRVEITPAS